MADLYKREIFVNPNIMYAFNTDIIEYDIRQAGYSLCKEYNLLDEKKMSKLESLDKDGRHKKIGIYQREDRQFTKALKDAFVDIRRRFLSDNSVDDNKIISIKKDAIFLMEPVEKRQFGEYVEFRDKNRYSSYIRLPNKIELYYHNGEIDVKGIDNEELRNFETGIMEFLKTMFRVIETESREVQLRVIMRYINKYKSHELESVYYKEFHPGGKIMLLGDDSNLGYDDYWEDRKDEINIQYNYFNVFIPIVKMLT